MRLRWIGHRLRAEVGLVVDSGLSVWDGHAVALEAKHRLLHRIDKLEDATVHVSPSALDGRDPHEGLAHHGRQRT